MVGRGAVPGSKWDEDHLRFAPMGAEGLVRDMLLAGLCGSEVGDRSLAEDVRAFRALQTSFVTMKALASVGDVVDAAVEVPVGNLGKSRARLLGLILGWYCVPLAGGRTGRQSGGRGRRPGVERTEGPGPPFSGGGDAGSRRGEFPGLPADPRCSAGPNVRDWMRWEAGFSRPNPTRRSLYS